MDRQGERRAGKAPAASQVTRLLSATLVATVTTGCPTANGPPPPGIAVYTPPPPPLDAACTAAQTSDPAVVKCCIVITKPEDQRSCTASEVQLANRCCPE